MRLLAASLLSMGVILLWAKFFAPKPPVLPPQPNKAVQTGPNDRWRRDGCDVASSANSAHGAAPQNTHDGGRCSGERRGTRASRKSEPLSSRTTCTAWSFRIAARW